MEQEKIVQEDLQSYSLEETKEIVFGKRGNLARELYEAELNLELLGEKIRSLRKQKNLSQAEFGNLIGVKKSQISKIENGTQNITIQTLLKVFDALQAKITLKIELLPL
jgi:HTH-type transcriptional regulator/antitoxin HipB